MNETFPVSLGIFRALAILNNIRYTTGRKWDARLRGHDVDIVKRVSQKIPSHPRRRVSHLLRKLSRSTIAIAFALVASPPAFATTFSVDTSGDVAATTVAVGTPSVTSGTALDLGSNTSSMLAPVGTTAQRPATGVAGMMRYNSTAPAQFEGYINSAWTGFQTAQTVPGGLINVLRNGTFDIWQRGTSLTASTTCCSYTADGWIVLPTGGNATVVQVANDRRNPRTLYMLEIEGASTITDAIVEQRIESYIAAGIAGQTATFQFWFYNGTGSMVTPKLTTKYAGSQDSWGSSTTDINAVSLQSCNMATYCQESYTFAVSSNAMTGYEVAVDFGNNLGSNTKYVYFGEADLRATPGVSTGVNANPPPAELRPIFAELPFNLRYYYQENVATGTYAYLATGIGNTTSQATFPVVLPTPMRDTPTLGSSAMSTFFITGAGGLQPSSFAVAHATPSVISVNANVSGTPLTVDNCYVLQTTSSSAYLSFSSEL